MRLDLDFDEYRRALAAKHIRERTPGIGRALPSSQQKRKMAQDRQQLKQLMDHYDYKVVVGFNVENATQYKLTDPVVNLHAGVVETPFSAIKPGEKGVFVARKSNYAPAGSYGTVSWKITPNSGQPRRVVVMWSAPVNFDVHNNYMAVGISDSSKEAQDLGWWEAMYYSQSALDEARIHDKGIRAHRKKYLRECSEVKVSDGKFCVEGQMGTGHKPQVFVTVNEE